MIFHSLNQSTLTSASMSESDPSLGLSESILSEKLKQLSSRISLISNETQLQNELDEIKVLDSEIDNLLNDLMARSTMAHEKTNLLLDLSKTELLTSLSSSSTLKKVLYDSSYLSKKLTYKVKFLDYQRARVSDTLQYVQHIIDLKSKISIISEGLEKRDWDTVSKSIEFVITKIPKEIVTNSKFADIVIPSSEIPERPEKLLKQWIGGLKKHFIKEFQAAVRTKDTVKLTNFFSYFPMIGESQAGLTCYSDFINNIIAEQARSLLLNAPADKLNFYSAALMKLFEIVSKIINQHSKVIVKYYTVDSMDSIISKIQREVDSQAGLISDTFWDVRNFDKIMHDISNYKFPLLADLQKSKESGDNDGTTYDETIEQIIPLVDVGDYIGEISTLLNRWSLYCRFIAIKYKEYDHSAVIKSPKSPDASKDKNSLTLVAPLIESAFLTKIEAKFIPCLDTLSFYYLKKSVEKSFKLEQLPLEDFIGYMKPIMKFSNDQTVTFTEIEDLKPLENLPVSSVVEDFIIIANTVLSNCLNTGQPIHVKTSISGMKKFVNDNFLKIFIVKLNGSRPRSSANIITATESLQSLKTSNKAENPSKGVITGNLTSLVEGSNANFQQNFSNMLMKGATALSSLGLNEEVKLINFVIYFNSVAIFKNYFNRITNKLCKANGALLENNFKFGKDAQILKELVDSEMVAPINKFCDLIIKQFANLFFNQIFKTKIRTMLNDFFATNSYLIDSTLMTNSEGEIKKFIKGWLVLVKPYYLVLAQDIFTVLNKLMIDYIVETLEKKVWQLNKKINLLGVVKLEKDISLIINEVTKVSYNLRESFIRITQIVMIMGFDDESEEEDMEWILTNNEKRRARSLRIDRK